MKKANLIFQDEVVRDYQVLNKRISGNIIKHMSSNGFKERNYVIKKQQNLNRIINILKFEASQNKTQALNTLGFLYYHGIEIEWNT